MVSFVAFCVGVFLKLSLLTGGLGKDMAVPFGFSVGDFIACISMINDVIGAFSGTRGARADYQLLKGTLESLQQSFEAIGQIPVDPQANFQQHAAITQTVDRCWKCIDSFLRRTLKYDVIGSADVPQDWKAKIQAGARKLQWAILKKDDIQKFKEDIHQQIEAISLLLATLQVYSAQGPLKYLH